MTVLPGVRRFVPVARGRACPVCGYRTERRHTPLLLFLPRRLLGLLGDSSYRSCSACRWKGLTLH